MVTPALPLPCVALVEGNLWPEMRSNSAYGSPERHLLADRRKLTFFTCFNKML